MIFMMQSKTFTDKVNNTHRMEENAELDNPLRGELEVLNSRVSRVKREIARAVVGQDSTVDLILAALFTGGHILEQDGFAVDTVKDGDAALAQVSRSEYELLVCDWKMPGLSGPQLYERIAESNPEAASRLIFMTGDVVSDSFQKFLRQHTKRCLSKPFSVQELRHSIGVFLCERQTTVATELSKN